MIETAETANYFIASSYSFNEQVNKRSLRVAVGYCLDESSINS